MATSHVLPVRSIIRTRTLHVNHRLPSAISTGSTVLRQLKPSFPTPRYRHTSSHTSIPNISTTTLATFPLHTRPLPKSSAPAAQFRRFTTSTSQSLSATLSHPDILNTTTTPPSPSPSPGQDIQINALWLSTQISRIGKCINFGIPATTSITPSTRARARALMDEDEDKGEKEKEKDVVKILAEVCKTLALEWRGLIAGAEGFVTGESSDAGLWRRRVEWGEMVCFISSSLSPDFDLWW